MAMAGNTVKVNIPEVLRKCRPLVMIPQRARKIVKEIIVTPIKNGAFLDSQSAAITLISLGGIRVGLLHLHGLVEKPIPDFSSTGQQVRAHPVVHHLEESPLSAGLVYSFHSGFNFYVVAI